MIKALIFDLHGVLVEHLTEPNFEMIKMIEDLRRQGLKTFVLTNDEPGQASEYRRLFPFLEDFDGFYIATQLGVYKPDPKAWQQILDEHELEPSACVYFDDHKRHVDGAKSLGINAYYYYENLDEMKQHLRSHGLDV